MNKSMRLKLIFILLVVIIILMTVICVFLVRGVQSFYTNEFYKQMQRVFSDEDLYADLRNAAKADHAVDRLCDIIAVYSGQLGIDTATRNYYILDGENAKVLAGTGDDRDDQEITPNILKALKGEPGYTYKTSDDYMDIAVSIKDEGNPYIIYIKDNKQTVKSLSSELFLIIIQAAAIGFVISVGISIILSKTILQPIQGMTKAAEEMAKGDFSRKIDVESEDEIGILARTFNDMASQLESTLEEIKKSEALRREFVANVSHELRTPITSIRSYAETLVDGGKDIPEDMERDFLGVIMNESDRMTKIVQDLLEISRFDAGSTRFEIEEFSLEQSVRDVFAAIELEAKKHSHTVNLELEWRLPPIRGDRSRIEQVLMNILSNAIKYTPDGGQINVYSGHTDDNVWVKVQDTGIGIPKEDMPRLFDRFYRVDKARSRESGGTGLGLSIAKEIVTRHGGEILVDSELGKGTTVTVVLPIRGPENE